MVAKKTPVKKTVAKKTVAKKPVAKKTVEKKVPAAKKAPAKKPVVAKKPAATKPKLTVKAKSEKDLASKRGEPYVKILNVELDVDNIGNGAFELDWNDVFVAKLVRAGYQGDTDADIVDNWFKTICRNILTEEYEQWEANQPEDLRPRVLDKRDLGGGKVEIS